jgi:hypothetical protein
MKSRIVELVIKDNDIGEIQDTYYLLNPNKDKLAELKQMIERRSDYQFEENLTDEEYLKAQELEDNIWEAIDLFISANFVTLTIDEIYEINY